MARVELMPGIERISGSIGNVVFKTYKNGKTIMMHRPEPVLSRNASRAERAQFKKRVIIDACVVLAQDQMEDMLEAIAQRKRIRDRMRYLYDKLSPEIKARTKLQKAIMTAYWADENGSRMDR